MKILAYKTSKAVLAAGSNIELKNGHYFSNGALFVDTTPDNAEILEVESVPDDFASMKYIFDGNWAINQVVLDQQRAIDQFLADTKYQVDRVNGTETQPIKYATKAEQLDMQYWDAINGTTTWRDHITEVKQAHPKPS